MTCRPRQRKIRPKRNSGDYGMKLQKKLEEDYERMKRRYLLLGPEELFQLSGEISRKIQIYRYCLRYSYAIEQIPDLAKKLLSLDDLLEDAYRFLVSLEMLEQNIEWDMLFWLDSQMCTIRSDYGLYST